MKVGIIGQGYVGLSLAIEVTQAGHQVIGFESNLSIVNNLNSGISHIEDVNDKQLATAIKENKYFSSIPDEKMDMCDILIIAVPTPLDIERQPDLSFLRNASDAIAKFVRSSKLIVNESTSFPGTLENEIAEKIYKLSKIEHLYASAPERVDPTNILWRQNNTPRIIAGLSDEATKKALDFYSTFCEQVIPVSSAKVAETAKLFENTFRQVNIALVNQLAQICHTIGVDTRAVLDAANTKPFGFMKFSPGLGVGGHCIPVDPSYLSYTAEKSGVKASFIDLANKINLEMPTYVVNRISDQIGGLDGKKIMVVGIAYKANVSDTRESPSILLINQLRALGAKVDWHDSLVQSHGSEKSREMTEGYDVAILAIAHKELDVDMLKVCATYIFDCTGTLAGVDGL